MRIKPIIMHKKPKKWDSLQVAALLHEDVLASSIALPMEILTGAAQAFGQPAVESVSINYYGKKAGPLTIQSGLTLFVDSIDLLPKADLLIIPAIWRQPLRVIRRHPKLINAVKEHLKDNGLTVSVGSGSFLLAETGLMAGRSATTHWHWFDAFAQRYPNVQLARNQLITQAGQVFCAGSVNSVADLMLYLCSQLFSTRVARHIENQFSPEIRQRFSPSPVGVSRDLHSDELVADAQIELNRDLRQSFSMDALATSFKVSKRTLARRFKTATGVPPGQYLQALRLSEAKVLLRRSNLSVTEIGMAVGLYDPSHFARVFRAQVGVSPRAFRIAVRGKSFGIGDKPV